MTEKEILNIEILEKAKIKIATNKDLKILYYKLKNVLSEKMDEKYEKLDKKIDQKFNALIITIIIQTLAIIGTLIGIFIII
jgi:hypothetical protein